jgi:3-methylfumaryl-CoA hydratase
VTFNSHRIHYDQAYTENEEGYPGLIVHGPLTATLLMQFATEDLETKSVRSFSFRAKRPLIAGMPFVIHGNPSGDGIDLWVTDAKGHIATEAQVQLNKQ